MDDDELMRWRAALATRPPADIPAEQLWDLADGALPPEEAAALVDKLSASPGSLFELELARAIQSELGAEVIRPRFGRTRIAAGLGVVLAIAAALLLLVKPPTDSPDGPGPLRGDQIALVTPLAAEQALSREDFTLQWEMPDGSRATVEVFDHLLSPLVRSPLLEAGRYTVPADRLPPSGRVFWQVRLLEDGQESVTALQAQIVEGAR